MTLISSDNEADRNSFPITADLTMNVYVLLYDVGKDSEGIHSLEISGETVVLLFENLDDAERYAGLLEAQDFPLPSAEQLRRDEVEQFCIQSGYEARFVPSGFVPETDEDILLLTPPQANRDVQNWRDNCEEDTNSNTPLDVNEDLSDIRKKLEGLL